MEECLIGGEGWKKWICNDKEKETAASDWIDENCDMSVLDFGEGGNLHAYACTQSIEQCGCCRMIGSCRFTLSLHMWTYGPNA